MSDLQLALDLADWCCSKAWIDMLAGHPNSGWQAFAAAFGMAARKEPE